jgi:Flp pilus assembly pilin Flp
MARNPSTAANRVASLFCGHSTAQLDNHWASAHVLCIKSRIDRSDWNFETKSMFSIFRKLMKSEQGATVIEYVLIASLISAAAIVAMGMAAAANVANTMN